jgi:hypothetical protein
MDRLQRREFITLLGGAAGHFGTLAARGAGEGSAGDRFLSKISMGRPKVWRAGLIGPCGKYALWSPFL